MTAMLLPNIPSAALMHQGFGMNDDALQNVDYRTTMPYTKEGMAQDIDMLWQRSSFPSELEGGGSNGFLGLEAMHQYWEWCWPPTGCHVRKVVSGVVRNSAGIPMSGATVQLFNTSTGLLVDTQVSASDGSYRCGDPNAVACFAVGYLPNAPDTAGTTVNTVTGT